MTSKPITVRAIERPTVAAFDDSLWPVNLLLFVLAAAMAAVIVRTGDFDATVWWQNAWFHLFALGATAFVLLLVVLLLQGRMQRRMQLAVLVSLAVHVGLSFVSARTLVGVAAGGVGETNTAPRDVEPLQTPDFHFQEPAQPSADDPLVRPVETDVPTASEPALPMIERAAVADAQVAKQPAAEPTSPEPPPLAPAEIERAEPSAPRRGESLAGERMSRQHLDEPIAPVPVETPEVDEKPQMGFDAQIAQQSREAMTVTAERPSIDAAMSRPDVAPAARIARAAGTGHDAIDPPTAGARSERQVAEARPAPPMAISTPATQAVARAAAAANSLAPSEMAPTRQQAAAPGERSVAPGAAGRVAPGSALAAVATPSRGAANASVEGASGASGIGPAATGTGDASRIARSEAVGSRVPGAGPIDLGEPGPAAAPASRGIEAAPSAGLGSSRIAGGATGSGSGGGASSPQRLPAGNGEATGAEGNGPGSGSSGTGRGAGALAQGAGGVRRAALADGAPVGTAPGSGSGGGGASGRAPLAAPAVDVAGGAGPIDVPVGSSGPQPGQGTGSGGGTGGGGGGNLAASTAPLERLSRLDGGVPAHAMAAPAGSDRASTNITPELGLPSRHARPESEVARATTGRLILEKSGGRLAIDARVQDTAVPGFKQRDSRGREEMATSRGGSEVTERSVERGLDFLARHQSPNGSWSLHNFAAGRTGYEKAGQAQMQSDTAGTGLALLAFLGAGYTHTDGKYRAVVGRGLDYLIQSQKADGDLFAGGSQYCWLYSHGIASIALCEAFGMTRDAGVRDAAQRALQFIAAAQSPTDGGWRYVPGRDTDTSVSGWQLMALKSGELAGLAVPPECYSRIERWLDAAHGPADPSRYMYRPRAEQAHQRQVSKAMTAEALLMRQYLGWKRDNPNLVAGADFLRENLPEFGTRTRPRRDAYYWYYATQVMFQMQGGHWDEWNNRLRELLTSTQVEMGLLAGSWDPLGPAAADRWGAAGGRIYVTAMHLLMLEVYYRHLPLYQNLEE
ncbi:MAG: hypothetical protein HYX69_07475 [Planctomycetia bacterium]|nr:hypothetical protein [Planctomycetia bacterium]